MAYYDSYIRCKLDSLKRTPPIFNGGMFNGLEYQVVTNPVTGRQWLDRNLGATRVATAVNDSQAYGWLFQWGRLADGHQNRTSPTRSEQSTGDVPGHQDFIIGFSDWRTPQNNNLWQGVDAINSVAPQGWRLPTEDEWNDERLSWGSNNNLGAFNSQLKIVPAGGRARDSGLLYSVGALGAYWCQYKSGTFIPYAYIVSNNSFISSNFRSVGLSVRLIKNI